MFMSLKTEKVPIKVRSIVYYAEGWWVYVKFKNCHGLGLIFSRSHVYAVLQHPSSIFGQD